MIVKFLARIFFLTTYFEENKNFAATEFLLSLTCTDFGGTKVLACRAIRVVIIFFSFLSKG